MTAKQPEATHPNAAAFPALSGPALRALATAGIRSLTELERWSERELLEMHGMGPKGMRILTEALASRGTSLRRD